MGNQPSLQQNAQNGHTAESTPKVKSILKDGFAERTPLSAGVAEAVAPEPKRRISRRASIAPPQLNEDTINSLLNEASIVPEFPNSTNDISKNEEALNEPIDQDVSANDSSANDSSANDSSANDSSAQERTHNSTAQDSAADNSTDQVSNQDSTAQDSNAHALPEITCVDSPTDEESATIGPGPTVSSESLLWAPALTSSEATPASNMPHIHRLREDSNLVSKIKKRASAMFGKEDEDISIDKIIKNLLACRGPKVQRRSIDIPKSHIEWVCRSCLEVVMSQPNLLEISGPVNVCGDVHGQYDDLIRIFEMCGYPPHANYLFLGDYVDRGKQSLETILLLMCFKIKYPENFFILRGNHECASVNKVYGFFDECKRRTNVKVWKTFTNLFNCLPIAALICDKIFCVHGGLSPELKDFDQIRNMKRPCDVPSSGLLNGMIKVNLYKDLLWADPSDAIDDWAENDRGVSFYFGKSAVNAFLENFSMDLVCRAHMVVEDGYEFFNDRRLVTVFSAPNYCGEFDNKGAVMTVDEKLMCSFKILEPLNNSVVPLSRETTILPSNY